MNVTVFGSGYVGLVTGACLADAGNNVLCVDIDGDRVERVTRAVLRELRPRLSADGRSQLASAVPDRMRDDWIG